MSTITELLKSALLSVILISGALIPALGIALIWADSPEQRSLFGRLLASDAVVLLSARALSSLFLD